MSSIRVLIVDDSALVRRLVATALSSDPEIDIVGQASDGLEAVAMVDELRPDVVTLDVEMPNLDGLGALARIRQRHRDLPVIMFSTLTERGARTTLDALAKGASDYVTKPSNTGRIADSLAAVRQQLLPRIHALTAARSSARGSQPVVIRRPPSARSSPTRALVIGCSTGGPDALARLLTLLPHDLGVPVLVVQHMPPVFTTMLAERLDRSVPMPVHEAVAGAPVRPGEVVIAPGDIHLALRRRVDSPSEVELVLDDGPEENFCRPAVDVLFRSAVQSYGEGVLAVVLTGMGRDGLVGARAIVDAGGRILVQDEESSVVWGMPGVIATAGLAEQVLPIEGLAMTIRNILAVPPRTPALRP